MADDATTDDPATHDRPPRRRAASKSPRGRRICALQSARNVLDHAQLTELREFDLARDWSVDGAGSAAQWLSWYTGVSAKTAYERLRVAHALATLRLIDDAMRRGEVSYTQARALTRLMAPELQHDLLELARGRSGEALERGIRQLRQRAAVDLGPAAPAALRATFARLGDDLVLLRAHLGAEQASRVKKTLQGIKQAAAPGRPTSMSDGEAMALMADRAARALPGEDPGTTAGRYEVAVLVSAEALQSKDGSRPPLTRCELEDGTQLSVDTARRIACDSPIRALLVQDDGTPLDVGRRTARVRKRLRKALILRDRHCTFPGCTSRLGLDAHHIEHWIDGGKTKASNLTLLCKRHHAEVHDQHYRLVRVGRRVEFYGRDGLLLPRGPSVPRYSPALPDVLDAAAFERFPGLRAALRLATDEWTARSLGRAA